MLPKLLLLSVLGLFWFSPRVASAEPQRTTVGVYVNNVTSVDLKNNAFTVDFWVWFRSRGREVAPVDAFELVGGRINSKSTPIKKKLADGQDYGSVRVNATIQRQWDLRKYPFDDHDLEIAIEDSELDVAKSVFVADAPNQGKDPEVAVAGWDIEPPTFEITDHLYQSNYGDTSISPGAESRFSRYVTRLHARRRGFSRFLKVAFPLLVSVLAAWCAFFIRPKDAGPRISVSVGALFAAAAGTIAINSQLPDVNYATVSDKTVFLSLGMISLSLIATVVALALHYAGDEARHRRVDRAGGIAFPLIYAAILAWIVS